MREILCRGILFRGQTEEGNWRQGLLVHLSDEEHGNCWAIIPDGAESYRFNMSGDYVKFNTIGQYTGLTDKNGTRIFEGDIIKHHRRLWGEDISDIGVVFWNAGTCQYRRTSSQNSETPQIWQSTAEHYEVIGNIHDNPNLMKGGAE